MIVLKGTVVIKEHNGFEGRTLSEFALCEEHTSLMPDNPAGKWSGLLYPPMIGNGVTVNFNGFGTGVVVDYFIQDGWLGVEVKLDKQPDWHIKQGGHNPIRVFGAEINYTQHSADVPPLSI
jgi:hypothetical protein